MAIFRCGFCDKNFPFRKRLEDHLKSHGLVKQYQVNKQINEWFEAGVISDQVPMTKCQHCGQEYNSKYKGDHFKKCPNYVPPESAKKSAPALSDEDTSPPGDRENFQTFLAKKVGLKSIKRHLTIFDEWVAHCEDPDGQPSGALMEDKLGSFIDKQPSASRKVEVYNTYTHVVAYFHQLAGNSGDPMVSFHLIDGKLVLGEEKAIHHRRRVHSPEKREDILTRGRGQRDRKHTVLYSAPQPAKVVKNPKGQPAPMAQHQATPAMEESRSPASCGPQQQGPVQEPQASTSRGPVQQGTVKKVGGVAYSLSRGRLEREAFNMNDEGDFSDEGDEDEWRPPRRRGEKEDFSAEESD